MANAKAKAKPAQAKEEAAPEFAEGSWVRFLGYEKGTKKEEMILNKDESYEVVALPGEEEVDGDVIQTGYVLRLENPDFDPKKKENPDTNPKFLETEVFPEEIEAGEAPEGEGDAITYEELAAYSKAELLEFATANEVKLTAAQKKTPETLLATLAAEFGLEPAAEEEEPETPPAKPETAAAKKKREAQEAADAKAAKAKPPTAAEKKAAAAAEKLAAAPKGKATAKGKAPAAPKDEEEEVDPDFVPELEGEDEAVLSLVEGDVDLVAVAQDLESAVAVSEYQLGGVLYHIKKEKLHLATDKKGKLLDPEYGETGGFKKFLLDNFNIDYRKATYLIDIYINFTLAGIENPSDVVGRIGWTKASKIAKLVGVEGADVDGLVDVAEKNTVADLSEIIKEQFSPEGGSDKPPSATRITLRFRYLEEEANVFEDALKELADQFGQKPEEALLQLVIDAHAREVSGAGGHNQEEEEQPAKGGKAATKPARGKARA
jgi:hypothetical protein